MRQGQALNRRVRRAQELAIGKARSRSSWPACSALCSFLTSNLRRRRSRLVEESVGDVKVNDCSTARICHMDRRDLVFLGAPSLLNLQLVVFCLPTLYCKPLIKVHGLVRGPYENMHRAIVSITIFTNCTYFFNGLFNLLF
jgi:hypothetical protein